MPSKGTWVVIEGIAGSGKTTLLDRARDRLHASKSSGVIPEWSALPHPPKVLFTYEPTHAWIGQALRSELFRMDQPYNTLEIAHAFALDRHILAKRLLHPALEAGAFVLQSRSFCSSLIYQADLDHTLSTEEILSLPGNTNALRHPPDHLIFFDLHPDVAWDRTHERQTENKGTFSEDRARLELWHARMHDPAYRALFESWGTQVHYLDTGLDLDITTDAFFALLHTIAPSPLCNVFSPLVN